MIGFTFGFGSILILLVVVLLASSVRIFREYERGSTTVVNAYVGPRVSTYSYDAASSSRTATRSGSHSHKKTGGLAPSGSLCGKYL